MESTILSPPTNEVQSLICFLQAKGNGTAWSCAVGGTTVINNGLVYDWYRQFKNNRTDVHNEGGQGHQLIMTKDMVHKVDQSV